MPFKFMTQLAYIHDKSRDKLNIDASLMPPDTELDKVLGITLSSLRFIVFPLLNRGQSNLKRIYETNSQS